MGRRYLTETVLLVEGHKQHSGLIQSVLKRAYPELKVDAVATLATSLKRLKEKRYKLILSDFGLKELAGAALLTRLKTAAPETPIIVLSSKQNNGDPAEVMELGAEDYILKNREALQDLPQIVEKALLRRKFSLQGPLAAVPINILSRIGSELDQLKARSNMIAKNAVNAPIIDSLQDSIGRLKKLAYKILPS